MGDNMSNKSKKIIKKTSVKKTEKKNNTVMSNTEIKNLLKIVLIICGVLLVFYFITDLVQNNKDADKSSDTTAVIQYNKILVGEILNRSEDEYYVLVEQENDSYVELYKQYLDNASKKIYYTVDLTEVFNQSSVGEETLVEGNEVDNYKFANTTLIKFTNGSLNGVFKNQDEIVEHLKSL